MRSGKNGVFFMPRGHLFVGMSEGEHGRFGKWSTAYLKANGKTRPGEAAGDGNGREAEDVKGRGVASAEWVEVFAVGKGFRCAGHGGRDQQVDGGEGLCDLAALNVHLPESDGVCGGVSSSGEAVDAVAGEGLVGIGSFGD